MANCDRVINSCADQNSAEKSFEGKFEETSSSADNTTSAKSTPSSGLSSNFHSRASVNTSSSWALTADAPVPSSLPTPPYTPHIVPSEYSSMADQFELNGELTEENNNVDENSNDQQYEQYSHFHHQHYLEQQALRERERNATSSNRHQEDFNTHGQVLNSRRNELYNQRQQQLVDQNHVPELMRNSEMQVNNSGHQVQEEISVRPKIASSNVTHRRMSLNPQHGMGSHQFMQPSAGISQNSASPATHGYQVSDQVASVSYFANNRQESNRGHQRRRSCDSGIAQLLRQDGSTDERDNAMGLPTLPRFPHLSATAENSSYSRQRNAWDTELPRSHTTTEREAEMLLYNFTREEISREHLAVPRDIARVQSLDDYNLMRAGTELRKLADAFAATPARSDVRIMAQKVLMSDITWENFMGLCLQLFSGTRGITAERVVALFTFIADVAKEQIRRGAESCIRQLMTWSLRFIFQSVCQWVDRAGGWGRVLQQGLDVVYKVAVSVLAGVAVVAVTAYIFKTWRS